MLVLPCTPRDLIHEVIVPALALFPVGYDSQDARALLTAIAKQESDLHYPRQIGGPARSLWMFERMGVLGVTLSHKVDDLAALACREARIACAATDIMRRIETDHVLACRLARLNLYKDRAPLPAATLASEQAAFDYYLRTWKPGAAQPDPNSHRDEDARARWSHSWTVAVEAVHV